MTWAHSRRSLPSSFDGVRSPDHVLGRRPAVGAPQAFEGVARFAKEDQWPLTGRIKTLAALDDALEGLVNGEFATIFPDLGDLVAQLRRREGLAEKAVDASLDRFNDITLTPARPEIINTGSRL